MQLLNWLPCFLLAVVLPVLAEEPPTELVIDTVYKPESCPNQAKTGDSIQVHYVRFIVSICCFEPDRCMLLADRNSVR